jgi:SAM-dependent methyltransferase
MSISWLRTFVNLHVTGSMRQHRLARFMELMHPSAGETVLDVGSYAGDFWARFAPRAMRTGWRVIICDILRPTPSPAVDSAFVADACALPLGTQSVDIIFSNSVLEHVGALANQRRYAAEIRRVARRYFIEVPNKHFPIEPHVYIPFFQYLPIPWQVRLTRLLFHEDSEVHLPDHARLRALFPTATIERERFLGLTKAFYIWERGSR